MAGDTPRPVHLRDQHRRGGTQPGGRVFAVCGALARVKDTTLHGWKVTCPVCNPPTRRKVRVKPRPPDPKMDLEMA